MIRINLLPQARKVARGAAASGGGGGAALWYASYALALIVTGGVCGVLYWSGSTTLDEKAKVNADLRRNIANRQRDSAQIDEVRAKLAESQELEQIADELQRARTGPTRALVEMSHILSEGGGPTIDPQRLDQIRRDNPLAGFNPGWDSRRLWLTEFVEDQHVCKIKGVGKTNEDVAELLARLALSDLFTNVTLDKTESTTDPDTSLPLIGFELSARVNY